jgi:hypothetical protein
MPFTWSGLLECLGCASRKDQVVEPKEKQSDDEKEPSSQRDVAPEGKEAIKVQEAAANLKLSTELPLENLENTERSKSPERLEAQIKEPQKSDLENNWENVSHDSASSCDSNSSWGNMTP